MPGLRYLKKIKESFAAKIFTVFAVLIIVVSTVFATFFIHHQRKSLTEAMISEGHLLARMLAYNSRLGVFSENEILLRDPLEGIIQHEGVLLAEVYTADGKLLKEVDRDSSAMSQRPPSLSPQAQKVIFATVTKTNTSLFQEGSDHFEFWAPVISTSQSAFGGDESLYFESKPAQPSELTIGFVRVAIDRTLFTSRLHSLILKSALIAFGFLLVGSAILYLVVQKIIEPFSRLTEGVKAQGSEGKLSKLAVESQDEIGRLAMAFNTMVESLAKRELEKQLLEEQLRHAQKMDAIGTLAGGIAHDFNNFLTAIIGYANLLQLNLPQPGESRGYADQIRAAAERAANLTQRLLAFGRKQAVHPRPFNLNEQIITLGKLLTTLIGEDVEFCIELQKGNLLIMADPGQIDQILINLATNARDAMPRGGKLTITTNTTELDDEAAKQHENVSAGSYARLTVTDTGIGLDENIRERIFDPFFTTKEVGKGTGLGLSMVYGIVKQHQGYIEVESAPDKGASFSIYIPLIETMLEPVKRPAPLMPKGNFETVLVAEDDFIVRAYTREVLEKHNYHVIEAADGIEAVARFVDNKDLISVVLLDVIMPKMNGKEVFEEINVIRPGIKTLFTSGYTYDIINRKGVHDKDINFVAKPVQADDLLLKLREVLSN